MSHSYSEKSIKLLFGGARKCAFPGCNAGLILEDRGLLTVVVEIAHIRSEKPNGPRYDPTYPRQLIDLPANLLLLCGTHHKPVDEHPERYPVAELERWKARQVSEGMVRDLTDHQVARIFQHYRLNALGHEGFLKTCQALAVHALGQDTEVTRNPGLGRYDAAFDGCVVGLPNQEAPWEGYIVLEALYQVRPDESPRALIHLRQRIKNHFEMWFGSSVRKHPEYVIFATNISLATTSERRTRAVAEVHHLLDMLVDQFGVKEAIIWDEARIVDLIELYPDVRDAVSALTTSNEQLDGVLDRSAAAVPSVQSLPSAFRPGQPGNEAQFQACYDLAGGASRLGRALGEVQEHELGWVQHFAGGPGGEPAVLCARFGHDVVPVAQHIWSDIMSIGDGIAGGGASGIGFPLASKDAQGGYVSSDSESVELAGGKWAKRGRLIRSASSMTVRWQPAIAFDSEAFRDRDTWASSTDEVELRIRLAARIPLSADEWRISSSGRRRLLAEADSSGVVRLLKQLAYGNSSSSAVGSWEELDDSFGLNNSRFAAYRISTEQDGSAVPLETRLLLMLPDGRFATDLCATVDLNINTNTRPSPTNSTGTYLTSSDVIEYLGEAWWLATQIMPLAASEDPFSLPPAGAPRLEIYIQTYQRQATDSHTMANVLDYIDFSDFGSPRRARLDLLSIGVTTPLALTTAEINDVIKQAITRMVEDAGFAVPPRSVLKAT
ncbi:hypothetical protein IU470_18790 [Nocardia abscessus]|uniref:HNH endonuclease n=1 Tax=Nocardia abscessus TaxID=120957 RepID=A0ABS0CEV2_9NOCA|nr:hypothetical protein [Nocardia abscessus]MBF6227144.1 hypothetical protein [Nocardia abscessus]